MSEQRRMRSELRQGLHQFLMGLYMSYLETVPQDEAKALVREALKEQFLYFEGEALEEASMKEGLTAKVEELTVQMEAASKEYDTQLWYAEKIDTLQAALEILETKTS